MRSCGWRMRPYGCTLCLSGSRRSARKIKTRTWRSATDQTSDKGGCYFALKCSVKIYRNHEGWKWSCDSQSSKMNCMTTLIPTLSQLWLAWLLSGANVKKINFFMAEFSNVLQLQIQLRLRQNCSVGFAGFPMSQSIPTPIKSLQQPLKFLLRVLYHCTLMFLGLVLLCRRKVLFISLLSLWIR